MADFYQELGVARDASTDQIKKAFRKLAAKLHPDKNPGDKRSEARFKVVSRAYEVLGDPQKRALYDEFGEDGLRDGFDAEAARAWKQGGQGRVRFRRNGGGGAGGFNVEEIFGGGAGGAAGGFGDLFGDLFSGRARGRGPQQQMKGPDVMSEVTIDFASAIRGTELKLKMQDDGEEVTARIPPGAGDGDKVRIPGHGAPGAFGGPRGDLLLVIHVRPHPYFERRGLDLYLDLPVTVKEAYQGAKVRVPTPESDVTLSVPKHAQSGQVVRLRGKGVRRKGDTGDLYVRFLIRLPEAETSGIERAVETLSEAQTEDVRSGLRF